MGFSGVGSNLYRSRKLSEFMMTTSETIWIDVDQSKESYLEMVGLPWIYSIYNIVFELFGDCQIFQEKN